MVKNTPKNAKKLIKKLIFMCFFKIFIKSKIIPDKNPDIISIKNIIGWLNVS